MKQTHPFPSSSLEFQMRPLLRRTAASASGFLRRRILSELAGNGAPLPRVGAVYAFGDNSHGAAGQPAPAADVYVPTPVPSLPTSVAAVAAGHYHSLAVSAEGEVWAWGRNDEGQLGRGHHAPR